MLKALELYGFKSFAEKTRFEFPEGITVIVGPNGSGKSNVVDAIKWVLGEQSAKSLRGQDMADVIFKGGSTQGARKPMNVAEATIIFENADRKLGIDAPEVHVTRRVYRSGEGEYLINRQPSRLKDIKDLFRGTGVGGDAYSLIEQGKVDRLLQASAKDRRAMFEEAAGISRFKAKKIDAQRRLDRVEQNLLRLSDIVEEVENRLKSVRAQASKARRYREYGERLQDLRTQVGLADWRQFSERLSAMEREITRLRDESAGLAAHTEMLEARTLELETEVSASQEANQLAETQLARTRQQIAVLESSIEQQRDRIHDLVEEFARQSGQLLELSSSAGNLSERAQEVGRTLSEAEVQHAQITDRASQQESELQSTTNEFEAVRAQMEQLRGEYVARMKQSATVANETSSIRSERVMLVEAQQRIRLRLDETAQELARVQQDHSSTSALCQQLLQETAKAEGNLENDLRELGDNRRLLARRQEEIVELLGRLSGAKERAIVLQELESRHEGISSGVTELLESALHRTPGPGSEICGLVADFVRASVELAPLVDVALGERSQFLIVRGTGLYEQIANGVHRPRGRMGLIPVTGEAVINPVELELQAGVIGRADRLVDIDREFLGPLTRLLSGTWFVEDLQTALELSRTSAGQGQRWVTRAGQLLEADGILISGPRSTMEGLVSRRSQLRELRERIEVLEYQIEEGQRESLRLRTNIEQQEVHCRQLQDTQAQRQYRLTEARSQLAANDRQMGELEQLRSKLALEIREADSQESILAQKLEASAAEIVRLEAELGQRESALRAEDLRLSELDRRRQEQTRLLTRTQIEVAKSEQRNVALRLERDQFEAARLERSRTLKEVESRMIHCHERQQSCAREMLRGTSELAPLYLLQQQLLDRIEGEKVRRLGMLSERATHLEQCQLHRKRLRANEEEYHQRELSAGKVRHERSALVDRLRDDYGIELSTLEAPTTGEELQQREQAEEEIHSLRKRIHALGAVNMDALAELDELESRFQLLSGQFQDLRGAKEALERIIQKINADSRRVFVETLDAIRTNFQALYRRAFGGGHADIVLEQGADVLEGGVEIIATPPGKPSFSNSLLSGGEKALTAVALLLAIFQFRPSPFCVLDEVDAPFDEANIGRFVEVLKEFLSFTKFVIVTHSKKTMTAANTLYGITMQESGVSKRVSVQFDDVTDDGEIVPEAVARDGAQAAEEEAA